MITAGPFSLSCAEWFLQSHPAASFLAFVKSPSPIPGLIEDNRVGGFPLLQGTSLGKHSWGKNQLLAGDKRKEASM